MPLAELKSTSLSHSAIDETTGVISGCKLMQSGKTATFKGKDGKVRSFEVTKELIQGLLAHAGNRSIPAHFTHEWVGSDKDALHARLGVHKNLRIDADGDLASDLHTMPNEYGKLALWTAKTDPQTAAFSAVFRYNEIAKDGKNYAVPIDFQSADFVAEGACVSAMLSSTQTDTDMTKEEIQAIVNDSVTAALKAYKPEGFITKAEAEAAVTAALSAHKVSDDDKKEIAILAQVETVKSLGATSMIATIGETQKNVDSFDKAIVAQLSAGAKNRGDAILRVARVQPELYNAALAAGKI